MRAISGDVLFAVVVWPMQAQGNDVCFRSICSCKRPLQHSCDYPLEDDLLGNSAAGRHRFRRQDTSPKGREESGVFVTDNVSGSAVAGVAWEIGQP